MCHTYPIIDTLDQLYSNTWEFVNQHMQSGIAINLAALARSRIMLHLNFRAGSTQPARQRYGPLSNTH